jgi:flagellar hook-associated protein 2
MSTSGIGGSGTMIDVQGIVSKLMTIEQRPLVGVQGRIKSAETSVSAMGQLMSSVDSLYTAATAIQDRSMLSSKSAASSDASLAKVVVSDSAQAPTGSYEFEAFSFARAQRSVFYGAGVDAVSDATVNRGNERLRIYTTSASSSYGALDVTLDFSGASLNQIRDEINNNAELKGKVSASVVRRADSSGAQLDYVLVLNGSLTGSDAAFSADWTVFSGAAMTVDVPAGSGLGAYGAQTASNAVAKINGVFVGSNTNTFANAIPGLSIEALKKTSSSSSGLVSITVGDSRNSLRSKLQAFATALSDFNKKSAELTKSGTTSTAPGPLASNSAVLSITAAISSSYSSGFTLNSQPGTNYYWSYLGLDMGRDGSVSFDGSKLDQALDSSQSFAASLLSGFSSTVYSTVASLRGSAGSIQSGLDSMRTNLSTLRSDETTLKSKLEARQKLLLAQYAALDSKLVTMGQKRANVANALAGLV